MKSLAKQIASYEETDSQAFLYARAQCESYLNTRKIVNSRMSQDEAQVKSNKAVNDAMKGAA